MIRITTLGLLLLAGACGKTIQLGESCGEAKECGKGADCYRGICTPMCLNDTECNGELVCALHHCVLATGEPMRAAAIQPAPAKADIRAVAKPVEPISDDPTVEPRPRPGTRGQTVPPPVPGDTLRALEARIDALSAEQKRLNDRIEALEKH